MLLQQLFESQRNDWYKAHTDLSLKQMIRLKDFAGGEENIAADTNHEDLFALMKHHGV